MQPNGAFSPHELIQINTDHDCINYRNAIYRLCRLIVIAGTAVAANTSCLTVGRYFQFGLPRIDGALSLAFRKKAELTIDMIPDLVVWYSCAIHSQTAAPVELEGCSVYGNVIALSTLSLMIMNVHCMCVFASASLAYTAKPFRVSLRNKAACNELA